MRPINETALNAVTATTNSTPLKTGFQISCSVQAVGTSTLAGAVKLQGSNDPAGTPGGPVNWNDIPSATVTLTGTAGAFLIPKTDLCYEWVRVVFTASGGAGTVTAQYKGYGF
jgi:hypothetical protein